MSAIYCYIFCSDSSTLSDHNIGESSKIHLFVKKATQNAPQQTVTLWTELHGFLCKHFHKSDAKEVLDSFKEVCV